MTTTDTPPQVHVVVPLGVDLHHIGAEGVLALLRGDDHPDRAVGLTPAHGDGEAAAFTFTTDEGDVEGDTARAVALVQSAGFTPGTVETYTPAELERLLLSQAAPLVASGGDES